MIFSPRLARGFPLLSAYQKKPPRFSWWLNSILPLILHAFVAVPFVMHRSWGAAPSPALRGLKPFLEKGFKNPKNFIPNHI